jgi:hypothetical protein
MAIKYYTLAVCVRSATQIEATGLQVKELMAKVAPLAK